MKIGKANYAGIFGEVIYPIQITSDKIISRSDLTVQEIELMEETCKKLETVLAERTVARSRGRWLLCKIGIHKKVSNQVGECACIRCQKPFSP